jgi:hypothetical protein
MSRPLLLTQNAISEHFRDGFVRHDSDCRRAFDNHQSGDSDPSLVEEKTFCICLTNETGPRVFAEQEKIRVFMTEKSTLQDLAHSCDFDMLSDAMERDWQQKSVTEKTSEMDSYNNWVDNLIDDACERAGYPSPSKGVLSAVTGTLKQGARDLRSKGSCLLRRFSGIQPQLSCPEEQIPAPENAPALAVRTVSEAQKEAKAEAQVAASSLLNEYTPSPLEHRGKDGKEYKRVAFGYYPDRDASFMHLVCNAMSEQLKKSGGEPPVLLLATGSTSASNAEGGGACSTASAAEEATIMGSLRPAAIATCTSSDKAVQTGHHPFRCSFLLAADHDPEFVKRMWPKIEIAMRKEVKEMANTTGVRGNLDMTEQEQEQEQEQQADQQKREEGPNVSRRGGSFEGNFNGEPRLVYGDGNRRHADCRPRTLSQWRFAVSKRDPVWLGSGLYAAEACIRTELWRNVELKSLPREVLGGLKPEFQGQPNWKRWQTLSEVASCLRDQGYGHKEGKGSHHLVWEVSVFVPKPPPSSPPKPGSPPRIQSTPVR